VKGTIVTYAAGPQLAAMAKALRRHGRPASEPVALIYRGTLPSQHTIRGTLAEIEQLVARADHRESAVLVVGRVVALRDHLRWYDTRPLFGLRVVVTRPRTQAAELVTRLEQMGADPIEVPTIQIVAPKNPAPLARACAQIGEFDWVVFTSANAVSHVMRRLLAGPGDVRDLKGVRLCAVGPATAEALSHYSIRTDLVPEEYRATGVVRALSQDRDLTGTRILLPRADLARDLLPAKLRQAGAHVTTVTAYRTTPVDLEAAGGPDIYGLLLERQVDIITFTSGSSVREGARHGPRRRPAQTGRCRLHRPGDGCRGHPTGHLDHDHAVRLHGTRDGASDRGPRDRTQAPRGERVIVTKDERPAHDTSEAQVPTDEPVGLGLIHRPRRLRSTAGIRALVQETRLSADMLVYPLFVCEGTGVRREVSSMPGVHQLSVDEAVRETRAARDDGVRAVLLFGLPARPARRHDGHHRRLSV